MLLLAPAVIAARRTAGDRALGGGTARNDTLPVDPALVTGTLPNGLRYYIRANHMPAHRAALRLAVNAGSILEDEDQRGLAHFLEHMAFNGTAHFPGHSLIESLEDAGMRFGPDINAGTSFDETIYMLQVPTDDGQSLAKGLEMLADWGGGGMTIDSSEVVAERGVVMGEWRFRTPDTASLKAFRHQDSVIYGGDSRYVTRLPIGDTTLIQRVLPGPIRRFYKDWYRPDLEAIFVVGDVEPRAVERAIRAKFGRIPMSSHPRQRPSIILPSGDQPVVDVYRGAVYPAITLLWKGPVRSAMTTADVRRELVETLLLRRINGRLLQLVERAQHPFINAAVGTATALARTSDAAFVRVIAPPDSLETGLAAALVELERIAQHGVPAPDLAREKEALARALESQAAAAPATPSDEYADAYVQHYLRGDVALMSATQRLAVARRLLPVISSRDVARAAAFWRRRSDLLVLVTLPEFTHVRPPTRASVLATLDSVAKKPLAADTATTVAEAPLVPHPPARGRIVRERRDATAGITEWTLANGARVLLKPTRSNPDEFWIRAEGLGGFSLLPDSLFFSSGRLVATVMNEAAGLGTFDRDALQGKLGTTVLRGFHVAIGNVDQSITMGGSPRDLTTLFQLLYLQFTAPKLDTAALAKWKRTLPSPEVSEGDELTYLFSRGDPRRAPTSSALVPFVDSAKALAVYHRVFGNASNLTFIIVGAITPEQVRPLVEQYVASLPGTSHKETPRSLGIQPWEGVLQRTARVFDVPKAETFLAFDGLLPTSQPDSVLTEFHQLSALGYVLSFKARNDLRERMGGTYGVGVQPDIYSDPEEHYRLTVQFVTAPDRVTEMMDALFQVLDSVRATGATADELRRIAAIQRRTHENSLLSNRYWLNSIERYDRLGIPLARITDPRFPLLTAADIQMAAKHYTPSGSYVQFTILPTDTTSVARRDSGGRTKR